MKEKKIAVAALAVAALAIIAFAVNSAVLSANLVGADDADEVVGNDESDEIEISGAGGGGWFLAGGAKNTFGFYLNSSDWSMSELVLQARDLGVKIEAYQFDTISFSYDSILGTGSAEAVGRALAGGVDASFHLVVEDNGDRSLDRFMLEVTTDVAQTWDIIGLGGGQIWVILQA